MLFFAAAGLAFVVFFEPFYSHSVDLTAISRSTGLPRAYLLDNYRALIRWLRPWETGPFSLAGFPFSPAAAYHFHQVKAIFKGLFAAGMAGGLLALFCLKGKGKGEARRTAGRTVLLLPALLGLLTALNPSRAFVLFHEWVFRNDYWIFDQQTDPIILILPEAYFLRCFAFILLLVAAGGGGLLLLGKRGQV